MKTLNQMWLKSSRRFGNQPAVVHESTSRTFVQQVERGRKLAGALHALGVKPQDRVSMLAMNTAEWFDYYCAAEMAGFIASTINFRMATPEFAYVLKDAAPRVLIFEAQYADAIGSLRAQLPDIAHYICIGNPRPEWAMNYDDLLAGGDPGAWTHEPVAEDIVRLIYTSGTTGRPKGVARSHRADVTAAQFIASGVGINDSTRQLLCMPMFHLGSQSMGAAATWMGGCNVLQRIFEPEAFLRLIQSEKITSLHLAPVMLQAVISLPNIKTFDTSTVKAIAYSAAPMPVSVLKKSIDLLGEIEFVNLYGGTEMGSGTLMTAYQHRRVVGTPRLASIGMAGQTNEIRIVDENERDCPPGQPGEILVRGDSLFSYYWNNSPATAESMREGWYRTGDIAQADEEGYMFLVDRKKDMIISGGENIYCREVEEALMAHAAVQDAAVIGVPDEKWGEAVKAIVILKEGQSVSEAALIDHCGTLIARYKRPKSAVFVKELPRLPSGKVHKPTLREKFR